MSYGYTPMTRTTRLLLGILYATLLTQGAVVGIILLEQSHPTSYQR